MLAHPLTRRNAAAGAAAAPATHPRAAALAARPPPRKITCRPAASAGGVAGHGGRHAFRGETPAPPAAPAPPATAPAPAKPAAPHGKAARPPPPPVSREPQTKTRIVVLGSGWGAAAFVKGLSPKLFGPDGPYELILVSPRNYMLFTPLLPSAMGGVVSEQSIAEPIRSILRGKGQYFEARATDIDPHTRTLTCLREFCEVCARRKAQGHGGGSHTDEDHTFTVNYDILVCAIGSVNATFGVPGVEEHAWFLRSMEDAQRLRRHISKALEHAALPGVTPERRREMLRFVVVGGGPTGVEVAAELHDFVQRDAGRKLGVEDDVSVCLVDGLDSLLNSFHTEVQTYAGEVFRHSGIDVRLGTKVVAVRDNHLEVETKDGAQGTIPFATCIWATGVAPHPLAAGLKAKLPPELQSSRRGLVVDGHLRVLGTRGTVFCIGDAAAAAGGPNKGSLPPTAQVARQEGEYLAALLSRHHLAPRPEAGAGAGPDPAADVVPLPKRAGPFRYFHLGALAYLGEEKGVMDLPFKLPFLKTLRGYLGAQTWRLLETYMQVSPRSRVLVAFDWLRTALFGRNTSDI